MLVLASNSPRRKRLLQQAGITIAKIVNPKIDETPLNNELPLKYVQRMALAKSYSVNKQANEFVITADTIVMRGHRIMGKPDNREVAEKYLELLSGRKHRVVTSVCLAHCDKIWIRNVLTVVKMKQFSKEDIKDYLDSGEWKGKAGGYAIQGRAARFIPSISGSYTNVVGLPMTETVNLLVGNGYNL